MTNEQFHNYVDKGATPVSPTKVEGKTTPTTIHHIMNAYGGIPNLATLTYL
jgi:hypothetical protein